jgi:hypothetical protein
MNPEQQKKHTTVTKTLAQRLDREVSDLYGAIASEIANREDEDAAITVRLNAQQAARLKAAGEQREYVDRGDKSTDARFDAFRGRTFWSRLSRLTTFGR